MNSFFNLVNIMKLVEICTLDDASTRITDEIVDMVKSIDKHPIVNNNHSGFIVNKLLIPFINNSAIMVDNNIATCEEFDNAMVMGANHPIGSLKLAGLIGLDVVYVILIKLKDTDSSIKISEGIIDLV